MNVASSAGRDWPTNADPVRAMLDTADFGDGMHWLEDNRSVLGRQRLQVLEAVCGAYTYRAARLHLEHGVRVNCVNPGAIETRLTPEFRGLIGSDTYDWIGEQIGRTGTPAEVAEVSSSFRSVTALR